jgi:sugar phosphate isomerase/epimerase
MSPTIALQLYSVREAMAKDFAGTVRKVAEIGYPAVETAGLPGATAKEAAKLFRQLGLAVSSIHMFPPPTGAKLDEAREMCADFGCRYIVSGYGPDDFKTPDLVKRTCNTFNEANAAITASGLKFAVHNHWWEYLKIGDRYIYQMMLEYLDPGVLFELDTYWVRTAGPDPVAIVKMLGSRAPLLHIKDGPADKDKPMTAVGDGILDFPAILKASAGSAEWLIVEIDRVAGDMMEAVARSYNYLKKIA